ncbi:MAG: hypothetical protein QXU74_01340 [Candidatus Aenigmatarchaeota archaeon]
MNGNKEELKFFEEQLYEAKQALFAARTIKQARFLQNRIKYLTEMVKEAKNKK